MGMCAPSIAPSKNMFVLSPGMRIPCNSLLIPCVLLTAELRCLGLCRATIYCGHDAGPPPAPLPESIVVGAVRAASVSESQALSQMSTLGIGRNSRWKCKWLVIHIFIQAAVNSIECFEMESTSNTLDTLYCPLLRISGNCSFTVYGYG